MGIGELVGAVQTAANGNGGLGKYESVAVIIITIGGLLLMLVGLVLIFRRLKALEHGFDANILKAMGLVLFIPTLLILAYRKTFQPETLAALFGTVAGYVLSHTKSTERTGQRTNQDQPPAMIS